jgi:hypothetical protein
MVAITPLRERGRDGEGEETTAISSSGSARPGAGSGAVSMEQRGAGVRGRTCPRARRQRRLRAEGERREARGWAPRAIERKRGGGGRVAGWAPNGPNSARVRVFRIYFFFFFSFLFKNINKYIFKNSKNHNNYSKIIYNQDIYFLTNISILINWIFNMKEILLNIQKSNMSKQKLF